VVVVGEGAVSNYYEYQCTNPLCGLVETRYKNTMYCRACHGGIVRIEPVDPLQAENEALRQRLEPVTAVYKRFNHLDRLLSDREWMCDGTSPFHKTAHDLWQAVKTAALEERSK
jgi:hypothetical protein